MESGEHHKGVADKTALPVSAGWTIFDKLYILKGVVYVVTDEPDKAPDIQFMYSKALFIDPGAEAEAARLPTDKEIRIISTKEAKQLFGTGAQIIDGVTVSSVAPAYLGDIDRVPYSSL